MARRNVHLRAQINRVVKEVRRSSISQRIKPADCSKMAASLRGPQTICGALSKAASPRYICQSCRQNLLRPNGQPVRAASTVLSSDRTRRGQNSTEVQAHSRASYATKSYKDYINIQKKQPIEDFQEFGAEDVKYEEASTWVGLETVGQEHPLGDVNKSTDRFKP